jgi:hypothetical protein
VGIAVSIKKGEFGGGGGRTYSASGYEVVMARKTQLARMAIRMK